MMLLVATKFVISVFVIVQLFIQICTINFFQQISIILSL